jgi:hypothetical protein
MPHKPDHHPHVETRKKPTHAVHHSAKPLTSTERIQRIFGSGAKKPLDEFVPRETYVVPKQEFHPFRKKSFYEKISSGLAEKGAPPLPIIALVALLIFGAILPTISVGILTFEPKNVDVYIAIQALDGNPLKDAKIVLAESQSFEEKYSAQTGPDGLAEFNGLPVNYKFVVYAIKDGNRIEVEDREITIPFKGSRKEIIIVKKAA